MSRRGTVLRHLGQVARFLVSLAILALLVHFVDVGRVVGLVRAADMRYVLLAVLVAVLDRLLMVVKWYPLLRVQGVEVSLGRAVRAYLASGVAHYLLPGSVGADMTRAVALGRGPRRVVEVGASIAAERLLGLVGSGILGMIAVAIAARDGIPLLVVALWGGGAAAVGIAALLVPLSGRARRFLERSVARFPEGRWTAIARRFGFAYALYRRHPRTLFWVGVLSTLEQFAPVAIAASMALAFGVSVPFSAFVVATTLAVFAGRLPVSLGGLGVGEGAMVYLLALYGVPAAGALAVALGCRLLEVLVNAGPAVVLWRELTVMPHRQPLPEMR